MQFKDLLKNASDMAGGGDERPAPGKSIIIAEHDRAAREVINAQVMALGYAPVVVESIDQLYMCVRALEPRLVVVNTALDGAGGTQIVAGIRAERVMQATMIMLVSDTAATPDAAAGTQVGADEYICKPIDAATLKLRLRELLMKSVRDTQVVNTFAPAAPKPTAAIDMERAEDLYVECCDFARDSFERAKRSTVPDLDRCRDLARRLVVECASNNRLLLKAIRPYSKEAGQQDAANVAIFAIKIGRGLNYDSEELTALAMAALCHEIGMSCVPSDIASAEGKYNKKQWSEIRLHPEHAYNILTKLGDQYQWLADAVYQEHERERGQGYPRGLKDDEICEFAKIIGLADTYESLSHPRTFRKAFIAFDALREIIGMRNTHFAPHIIRALVSEVSVFPLDSYVQLNTGEIARVVRTSIDNLLRPAVVVEYDASSQRLRRPKLIDLAAKPLLFVTQPVDERSLQNPERGTQR